MLVDHGFPGAAAYVLMVVWLLFALARLRREYRGEDGFMATLLPAVAGSLLAVVVGDLFVQYPKLEVRFWLLTLVMTMLSMAAARRTHAASASDESDRVAVPAELKGRAA